MIHLEPYQLKALLLATAETAIERYMRKNEPKKDLISQRQAFSLYGEGSVKRWERAKQLTTLRGGPTKNSPILYSKSEMQAIFSAENLLMQKIRLNAV